MCRFSRIAVVAVAVVALRVAHAETPLCYKLESVGCYQISPENTFMKILSQ
jgi:hypothetical protein